MEPSASVAHLVTETHPTNLLAGLPSHYPTTTHRGESFGAARPGLHLKTEAKVLYANVHLSGGIPSVWIPEIGVRAELNTDSGAFRTCYSRKPKDILVSFDQGHARYRIELGGV